MHDDQLQQISLDQIDDPYEPMRTAMDEEKLDELAASIKAHGLIQPITLRAREGRFEVIAGHRRFKAARRAGMVLVPAIVRNIDEQEADAQRIHENLFREDINPVDEARHIRLMVDKHGMEPAALARMTGKSESYLRARYDLLEYPAYLIAAVEAELVGLTAAAWLAKIDDDRVREEYTRFAAQGGITAKRAEAWFQSWKLGQLPREAHMYEAPPDAAQEGPRTIQMPCELCGHDDDIEHMRMGYVHAECQKAARDVRA